MGISAEEVCDPRRNSRDESIRAARRYCQDRTSYDLEVARYLTHLLIASKVDVDIVERALEVLAAVAPAPRLYGVIRITISHDNARVRSKAAVAVGRCVADLPLLQRLLGDSDPRVRANTLEALWHMSGPDIESIFVRSLSDSHHRAAANAAYGLYLIEPVKYFETITALTEHTQPERRATGAWVLGKIGDPKHLPMLQPLLREKNKEVRGAAFRALKDLRSNEGERFEKR